MIKIEDKNQIAVKDINKNNQKKIKIATIK